VPLSQTGAELLFEIFSQRHERGSTIITSNLPFEEWTSVFQSQHLTGALLDRLTHHVHVLELNGESYRLKPSPPARSPICRSPSQQNHQHFLNAVSVPAAKPRPSPPGRTHLLATFHTHTGLLLLRHVGLVFLRCFHAYLAAAGIAEDRSDRVEAYRGDTLCGSGKAGELAKWTVRENDHGNPSMQSVGSRFPQRACGQNRHF
jgi:hypothetical protein